MPQSTEPSEAMGPAEGGRLDPPTRRLVTALSVSTFLQWAGASAILPMLPVYLRHQGGSDTLVGAVMGAFFIAGVLFQYPAGRVADRVGSPQVLVAGLVLYAVASLGFLAPFGPEAAIGLRALQGVGAGAAEVAALAMVAATVAPQRRGAAFGRVYGALIAGLAVGPLVGSLVGADHMSWIFVAAACTSLLGAVPVLRLHARAPTGHNAPLGGPDDAPGVPGQGDWRNRALVGALVAAAVIGITSGVYEGCWTLLLRDRGATNWQIGLSWTMFAVPFVAMARPAGWLADHLDRRTVAVVGLGSSSAFCAIYPWLHNIGVMLLLAIVEAVGAAITYPSVQSLLTQAVAARRSGHAQGLFASSQTAATGLAAGAGGALFGLAAWSPFVACAVAATGLTASLPLWWRHTGGRVEAASGLQVADRPGQIVELVTPPTGLFHGSYHELGEPDADEVLEERAKPGQP